MYDTGMNRLMMNRTLIALVVASALLASCASQQGSTYASIVQAEKNRNGQTADKSGAPAQRTTSNSGAIAPGSPAESDTAQQTPFVPGSEPVKNTESDRHGASITLQTALMTGTSIQITSTPSNASVYVNGRFQGFTPVTMENPPLGAYVIRIELAGYYPVVRRIDLPSGIGVTMDTTLAQITGHLVVDSSPADSTVTVDGQQANPFGSEWPVGTHRVRVSKFAYEDFVSTVNIEANRTTYLAATLKPAQFLLSDVSTGRPRFNPNNPGPLGVSNIGFRVTSFGHATVTIAPEQQNTPARNTLSGPEFSRTFVIPSFSTWNQQVGWNGRNNDGILAPNGTYVATIVATPADGGPPQTRSVMVIVDSSLSIRYRSMLGGAPGLTYVPIADVLPGGSIQIGTQFLGHVGLDSQQNLQARVPLMAGLRYGTGYGLEVDGTVQGILNTDPTLNDASVSLGGRWRYAEVPFGADLGLSGALQMRATFLSNAATDTLTNFDGLSLSAPISVHLGPIGLSLSPEILASTYPVYPVTASSAQGAYLWGYGRAGIYFDTPSVLAGVSAAVRTIPFLSPAGTTIPTGTGVAAGWVLLPVDVAAEMHLMLPGTSFIVSLSAAGEFSSLTDYYILGGGGIAFLY